MADIVPFGTGRFLSRRNPSGLVFKDKQFLNDFLTPLGSFNVDVRDKGNYYEVKADLPGVDKNLIDVNVENSVMTITVNTWKETRKGSDGFVFSERIAATRSRTFAVGDVRADDIKGSYRDGILTLLVPKAKDTKDKVNHKVVIE